MATNIIQHPLFTFLPVGQDVIFTVTNDNIVTNTNNTRVKFVAEVHISNEPIDLSNNNNVVGTFKTTPNAVASGIFNFSPIIENYVKADNMALENSKYKGTTNTKLNTPIHLIDKFSRNNNSFRYFAIQFKVEYFDNDPDNLTTYNTLVTAGFKNSDEYNLFNGYLKYSDLLTVGAFSGNNFGYDLESFNLSYNQTTNGFLSNAPVVQYANINDYGTVAMLNIANTFDSHDNGVKTISISYLNAAGGSLGGEFLDITDVASGGYPYTEMSRGKNMLIYIGLFPGNLQNYSTDFIANKDDIDSITYSVISFFGGVSAPASKTYTIKINCPTLKGYEPIRLAWLNQWGVWDYYTFTMKSSKTTSTKGTTYRQLEGTWNSDIYRLDGFKGGKKAFRVNATEKITMNTDFVSESESEWFQELINSPEVYILDGFQTDITNPSLNNYSTPVRLTTKSYTKKTVANDKLMQYTFEVEKTKTLRTQSV